MNSIVDDADRAIKAGLASAGDMIVFSFRALYGAFRPPFDAPPGIRGDFNPIATSVPGLRVGELMPRTARLVDKVAVLRAVSTDDNAHSSSGYWMLTGRPHQPTNSENAKPGAPNDWPCVAAIVKKLRPGQGGLPSAVTVPEHIWNTGMLSWPGQDGGFLGRAADPWLVPCDPNSPKFHVPGLALPTEVPPLRFHERTRLLDAVQGHLDRIDRSPAVAQFDIRSRQALDLLRGGKARRAFQLDEEPEKLRERYGRNRFGQSVLLARRLVEAGVSLVQVNWTRLPGDTDDAPAWDTHARNSERLKKNLMPVMDQAYSALLEDLSMRGLLDETLVVWAGEFGRTPKINARGGRDHWGHVFSAALAGGGVKGGVVHGASDKIGGYVRDGKVRPEDLTATIFHCLGYKPDTEIHDTLGRPLPISRGAVIQQVLRLSSGRALAREQTPMAYNDFTLAEVEKRLGVTTQQVNLFPTLTPIPVPAWLREILDRGLQLALLSEKARSEFIVVPILLAARELSHNAFAIYSGQRLDVDPARGLVGECDYILTLTPPVPLLKAPITTIAEAKKNDIEGGLGQCAAQMVGARVFNQSEGRDLPAMFGCVTTGETWQFLRLDDGAVSLDRTHYYIDNVGGILAAFQAIVAACQATPAPVATAGT